MIEFQWISDALKDRRLNIVSEATGLSTVTIANIRDGKAKNPTIGTLDKLARYLEGGAGVA